METPGNQVDETVQKIGTLTLSEQGMEAGDAEETQLAGVDIGDAGKTHTAAVDTGDAGETQLTGVETGDAKETQLAGEGTGDAGETQLTGEGTGDAGETQPTGVETGDAGETAQGRDGDMEEHEQTAGASGGDSELSKHNIVLMSLLQLEKKAKAKKVSKAEDEQDEQWRELWHKKMTPVLEIIDRHVMTGQGDSIMNVARSIKEKNSQQPEPLEVEDWIHLVEILEYGPASLIFLWCACCSADCHQADEIAGCLVEMNRIVLATEDERERGKLGNVLCILSENLEAVFETPDGSADDWFTHIILRNIGNKASGFVQQLKFREGIQVYETCIAKMRQRLGDNVMVGQNLTMLGELRLGLNADSPEGLENLRDARAVLHHAKTTSGLERHYRTELLNLIDNTLEVERVEKASTSEQEDSRKEKSVNDKNRKFVKIFSRRYFQRFFKRKERSNDPSRSDDPSASSSEY